MSYPLQGDRGERIEVSAEPPVRRKVLLSVGGDPVESLALLFLLDQEPESDEPSDEGSQPVDGHPGPVR